MFNFWGSLQMRRSAKLGGYKEKMLEQNKKERHPNGCLSLLYTRVRVPLLPSGTQHAEVGFVTAASVTNLTMLYPAFSGKTCIATGRSPERQRRARRPLSGTALLQKRNEPHP